VGVLISNFCWKIPETSQFSSHILSVSADRRSLYLKEDDYFFRTFFSDKPLMEGIHFWEIIADARTEHELKIGISKSIECDQRTAFCDYDFGWAFFGVGQLRHNSNATGEPYGKAIKR
jgi:E3 ubiquitin-protein ligase NRDP1